MSYISLYFIAFVIAAIVLYYILPAKVRWGVLLVFSLGFYATWDARGLIYVALSLIAAYFTALAVQKVHDTEGLSKEEAKKKARRVFFPGMFLILGLLVVTKVGRLILQGFSGSSVSMLIVPLGISYYTFALLGYLADVLWKKDVPEKNPLKLLLYMIYFPQIVEGPIPRHKKLAESLSAEHPFDFTKICFGMQRVLWGYFKKLVVADRATVIVNAVFDPAQSQGGFILLIGILFSALQLYADFSGCMDIAIGVSQCFGVELEENFRRPFYARTASEFWHRWHITLGNWFRDYVCMHATMFSSVKELSKKARKKYGAQAGRNVTTCIALAITWVCTGLWHGTGLGYLMWGIYWGAILVFSTVFEPSLKKLNEKLGIDENAGWFRCFQMLRTFCIFCGGKLITQAGTPGAILGILRRIVTGLNPWVFFDGSLYELGLERPDFTAMLFGLFVMWIVGSLQERGVRIREGVAKAPLAVRWAVYMTAVFTVMIWGYYGAGFDAASFVYQTF